MRTDEAHIAAASGALDALLDRYQVGTRVREFVQRDHLLLIEGRWQGAASGERIPVYEPSTGAQMTTLAAAGPADVAAAVSAAQRGFRDGRWTSLTPSARESILLELARLLEADTDFLAALESLDNGKPYLAARDLDVPDALRFARYMAGWATKIHGQTMTLSAPQSPLGLTMREPVGVVAAITPWNFPLNMAVQKVFPALAAGCSVVLKPSEQTSLTALRLGELALQAGVPEGVLSILTGTGAVAGDALVRHPDVAKITFTGSTAVGKRIGKIAMDNVARVTLELGGKSPMIVLADADLDRAARGVVDGIFFNAGQVCCGASRLYVERSVHGPLMERVIAHAQALRLCAGLDPTCEMGPVVSALQQERVRAYIDIGAWEGQVLAGGSDWQGDGYFVRPTVLSDLPDDSRVVREEIFGPVVVAAPFDSDEQVLQRANDTRYGLAASIWSNDLARIRRLAGGIRAGTVWINTHNPIDAALPFGGYGLSGFGREGGAEQLDAFLETKSVWVAA